MKLTPLYEALIFIEDKGQTTVNDLKFLKPSVLRGILGKMEAMKLIDRLSSEDFRISHNGQELLNKYLDNLHESTLHFDGKWRVACFSIPETKRSLRDKLRRELDSIGFKMILTGLWISPLDLRKELEDYAKKIGVHKNVFICETDKISTGISQEELLALWGFEDSREEIYEFIKESEDFLKIRSRSSFETKKMIFKYALILNNQPKVPIELFPKDWPQFRANLVYKKIRRLLSN